MLGRSGLGGAGDPPRRGAPRRVPGGVSPRDPHAGGVRTRSVGCRPRETGAQRRGAWKNKSSQDDRFSDRGITYQGTL